jgi:hypothetical protein
MAEDLLLDGDDENSIVDKPHIRQFSSSLLTEFVVGQHDEPRRQGLIFESMNKSAKLLFLFDDKELPYNENGW